MADMLRSDVWSGFNAHVEGLVAGLAVDGGGSGAHLAHRLLQLPHADARLGQRRLHVRHLEHRLQQRVHACAART